MNEPLDCKLANEGMYEEGLLVQEMVSALKAAVLVLDSRAEKLGCDLGGPVLDNIQAVISKVEGGVTCQKNAT